jgi:hypothetical protein
MCSSCYCTPSSQESKYPYLLFSLVLIFRVYIYIYKFISNRWQTPYCTRSNKHLSKIWWCEINMSFNIAEYNTDSVFSFRTRAFLHADQPSFSWNGRKVSHWRFHANRRMYTSADVSKFKISCDCLSLC